MSIINSAAQLNIKGLYPDGKPRSITSMDSFLISAIAPSIAVLFTNPFDTAKVRLQLQGQMSSGIRYKNSFDALQKIMANEGVSGLQKGLVPAVLREASKNFFRIVSLGLGMFDPIMNVIHDPKSGRAPGWKRVFAGSLCGVMGAVSANPFELIKTRLQSAALGLNAVGVQHGYAGVFSGLRKIYTSEGVSGLYRGSLLSMGRSVVGSGANLSTFSLMKEYLVVERKWNDGALLDMVAGLSSGAVSVLFMNPIDVIRTRYYNQSYSNGNGTSYTSGMDAFHKILTKEGAGAFYKGFLSHFLRIGPHFCLTFMFLGVLRRRTCDYYSHLDQRDAFDSFDLDHNGRLNQIEVSKALERIFKHSIDSKELQEYTKEVMAEKSEIDFHDYQSSMERKLKELYLRKL